MSYTSTSVEMNATTIANYITKLEKENAESRLKIEQLKKLFEEADRARVAALEKLNAKTSLYESTARTKTYEVNKDIAEHLRELGKMTSDFYKTAAYQRAADIVAHLDHEVESGESLLNINGIGKNIAARIDDFLEEYHNNESDTESVTSTDGQIIIDDSESESESESDSDFFTSYNSELTDVFDKLASYEGDSHKRNAYRKAADAIYNLPFKVKNGSELATGPMKVAGIGKGISKKIDEFLSTGKVQRLEKLMAVDESHDDYFVDVRPESNPVSTNEEIAWALETLASLEAKTKDSNPHKIHSYKLAAKIIRGLDFEVLSGEEIAKGPNKIKGIGMGIAKKIDEFLQTGKIKRIEELTR